MKTRKIRRAMSTDFNFGMVAMSAYLIALSIAAWYAMIDRRAHWSIRWLAGFAIFDAMLLFAIYFLEPVYGRYIQGEGSEGTGWMLLSSWLVAGAIALFVCGPVLLVYHVVRWRRNRRD
jgi:hypothetical protein